MTKNSGRELLPHLERQPDDDGRADALDRADAHGAAVQLGERAAIGAGQSDPISAMLRLMAAISSLL